MGRILEFVSIVILSSLISYNSIAKPLKVLSRPYEYLVIEHNVEEIFDYTFSRFNYLSDDTQWGGDYWIDWSESIEQGAEFFGDCDDFSLTLYTLLAKAGISSQIYMVQIPKHQWKHDDKPEYHTVVRVQWIKDNMIYDSMLDNRYHSIREWHDGVRGSMYNHIILWPKQIWEKKVRVISQ